LDFAALDAFINLSLMLPLDFLSPKLLVLIIFLLFHRLFPIANAFFMASVKFAIEITVCDCSLL
jgi:hypothetical protein